MSYTHLMMIPILMVFLSVNDAVRAMGQEVEDRTAVLREIEKLESQRTELDSRITALKAKLGRPIDEKSKSSDAVQSAKLYGTAHEILQELPNELKPLRGTGWDKFTIGKVQEWLSREPIGEEFSATQKISSIQVKRNPNSYNNKSLPAWQATIYLEQREWKLPGIAITQAVGGSWPLPLYVNGDEDFAKRAEAIKQGHAVTVKGKIKSIYLGPEAKGRRLMHIGLMEYTLDSDLLRAEK